VAARPLGYAAHLETAALGHTGAGGDVSSKPWRRENALDAQERAATQWLTPERAGRSPCIPSRSSEAWRAPAPLPSPGRHGCRANAVWRCHME
jgi:hypothetical protein